jgi:hypothetical protein
LNFSVAKQIGVSYFFNKLYMGMCSCPVWKSIEDSLKDFGGIHLDLSAVHGAEKTNSEQKIILGWNALFKRGVPACLWSGD